MKKKILFWCLFPFIWLTVLVLAISSKLFGYFNLGLDWLADKLDDFEDWCFGRNDE